MIFYTITAGTNVIGWAGTQADAKQLTKDLASGDYSGEKLTWEEHDVPTDKPTLLAFLKANCVGKPVRKVTSVTPTSPSSKVNPQWTPQQTSPSPHGTTFLGRDIDQ